MGFNFAGIITKKTFADERELENFLGKNIECEKDVNFQDAISHSRDETALDIFQTESGTFLLTPFGQSYDLSVFNIESVQFIVSDVASTYYFEKYKDGEIIRKFIVSEGEVFEDFGKDKITTDDDLTERIWEFADEYLQNNFTEKMFELNFKRYKF